MAGGKENTPESPLTATWNPARTRAPLPPATDCSPIGEEQPACEEDANDVLKPHPHALCVAMAAVIFCGHCGERAEAGERFCIACGSALRAQQPGQSLDGPVTSEVSRAVALLAAHDPAGALAILEPFCQGQPGNAIGRAYLGIAYLRLSRVADARFEVEEAVRIAPESFICRSKYGELLARVGFYDQAMAQLDLALAATAPDSESRHAAMELRQFCKEQGKGLIYRRLEYPRLSVPGLFRRRATHHAIAVELERGV